MPVRPENRARYPSDWKAISLRIRQQRAGDRCECLGECGHDHAVWLGEGSATRCRAMNGEPHPVTCSRVVLTVAHLDHQPENCADANLRAFCQRCHLAYDRHQHAATRRSRRAGGDLFTPEGNPAP